MSALLNYKQEGHGQTVVLIHGLFGSFSNLGLLARDLVQDHCVISIDLRNHGLSFHSETHNYEVMAQDVADLLRYLNIEPALVIGHSMGGKVAMKLADVAPEFVKRLIVLDMAPVSYQTNRHDNVFNGLQAVIKENRPIASKRWIFLLNILKSMALDNSCRNRCTKMVTKWTGALTLQVCSTTTTTSLAGKKLHQPTFLRCLLKAVIPTI